MKKPTKYLFIAIALLVTVSGCSILDKGIDLLDEIDPTSSIAAKVVPGVIAGLGATAREAGGDVWGTATVAAGAAVTAILGAYAGARRRERKNRKS